MQSLKLNLIQIIRGFPTGNRYKSFLHKQWDEEPVFFNIKVKVEKACEIDLARNVIEEYGNIKLLNRYSY